MHMAIKKSWLVLATFLAGCSVGIDGMEDNESNDLLDAQANEIVENLKAADYPESEIEVRDNGLVFVGGDAEVSLEASRAMAGIVDDEDPALRRGREGTGGRQRADPSFRVAPREFEQQAGLPGSGGPLDRDETADMFVERGVDAVIVGNAS